MERKLRWVLLACLCLSTAAWSQNLVKNPSFEDGSAITAPGQINHADFWSDDCSHPDIPQKSDVFDALSTNPSTGVPNNLYGSMPERTGLNRYAHIFAGGGAATTPFRTEGIKGTLEEPLGQGCYNFSFYAVSDGSIFVPFTFPDQILEVHLVSGSNCTGKLVYTSPSSIPDNGTWNNYSSSFTISASEDGLYDRILFRLVKAEPGIDPQIYNRSVYLDDVSIVSGGGTLPITADHAICPGSTTTLNTTGGFDNYLWSNGATTASTTVNSPGTYTVSAWNNGSDCPSTASVTVTLADLPKIKLPKLIYACNGLFSMICGPTPPSGTTYSYEWWGPHPSLPISVLLSTDSCFIPSDYGSYSLKVTDNATGCSSTHSFTIAPTIFPVLNLKDIYYCGRVPATLGLKFPVREAIGYSWTYNGNPVPGATNYNLPNMGDGVYCLTVYYSRGCYYETCFTVEECCEPNPQFNFSFNLTGAPKSLTVSNDPSFTDDYDLEQFFVYRYCGSETDPTSMTWTLVGSMSRASGFNTPYTFSGPMIQENCWYKVVHGVTSKCLQKSFVYTQLHHAGALNFTVGPNPVLRGEPFKVWLDSEVDGVATVEITNLLSGQVVLKGNIANGRPFVGTLNPRGENSMYAIRITTKTDTAVKKLMVR